MLSLQFTRAQLIWAGRTALFLVYFWFGLPKLFGASPAETVVEELLHTILPFFPGDQFVILLGVVEVFLGLGFLIPRLTKVVVTVMIGHMVTTFLPLLLLPHLVWQNFPVPTLAGQYIIKNVVLVVLALLIYSDNQASRRK